MVGVRKAGLALKLDAITKGDNNCFFNAVFAQVQRPDVAQELAGEAPIRGPHDLRLKVARFAKKSKLAVVDKFKRIYYETYPPELWDGFWNRMQQDQEWADAITAQATAWFLHHDIHIVFACGAEKTFFGSWDREGASCDKTILLLGYLNNIHYQSLLPQGEAVFSPATFQPMAFHDIIKVVLEAQREKNQTQQGQGGSNLEDQIPPKKAKPAENGAKNWDFDFKWSSGTLCVKPTKDKGWICPFCHSEEKRIMSHIKRKHLKPNQVQDFANIEKDFRKHTTNKAVQIHNKRKIEVDEDGFKEKNKKAMQDSRNRQRKSDEDGFKKQRSRAQQVTRNRKRVTDKEGFMEKQREAGQVSKKKRLNEDPKKFRRLKIRADRKYKKTQASSHQAAVMRFYQETRYGPVFGCVCCGIENFRHNVVSWNEKTQAQIRTKANDAHIRDYNSKLEQVVATLAVYF